jgi:hypothetical protein
VLTYNSTKLLDGSKLGPVIDCRTGVSPENLLQVPVAIRQESGIVIQIFLV